MGTASRRPAWISGLVTVLVAVLAVLTWWLAPDGEPGGGSPGPTASAPVGPSSAAPTQAPEARTGADPHSGLPWIAPEDLPEQAHQVLELIADGGPFRYDQDGSTFGNYEGLLPEERRGYYREYTVETPGLGHRGPRRIVTGSAGESYWTADHYASFERIAE